MSLSPFPDVVVQDIQYLEELSTGPYKNTFPRMESSYFEEVSKIREKDSLFLNSFGTLSHRRLREDDEIEKDGKRLKKYIKRQETLRKVALIIGVGELTLYFTTLFHVFSFRLITVRKLA